MKEGTGKWKRGRDGNSINGVVWCQSKIVTSMRQRPYKKGICPFEVDQIRACNSCHLNHDSTSRESEEFHSKTKMECVVHFPFLK